ncbi:MAG: hypothetical protein CMJ86_01215 [Planctomycetes bacterium]|jgi:MoaA/NifB/PqqE/SkfB family radical SAM enzyme|nr:hypothetical protein [Planctomycetota bacterium]
MHNESSRKYSIAVILLQPQCNMTCSFCVTENDFDRMEYSEALRLLDHLRDDGIRTVIFGGGEPFAWPGDLIALASQAKARGMIVQVGTNGVDLPAGFSGLTCIDRWILPLESVAPNIHNAMRQWRGGHHGTIVERLGELQRACRTVTVSTVLTAVNIDGVADLARYLREYHSVAENVHAWHLYQFLPIGRGGERSKAELAIPPEQFEAACESVRCDELPFSVFRRADMYRPRTIAFYWSKDGILRSGSEALHGVAGHRTRGAFEIP